jgi:hypothetical protein
MLKKFRAMFILLALGLSVQLALSQSQPLANQKHTTGAAVASPADVPAQMQNVQTKDVPKEIYDASHQLQVAKADLEQAGGEWGGHKANAMNHVNQALRELQLAIEYAKSH